jgi:prolipoprotein diacylglyceryltransferase
MNVGNFLFVVGVLIAALGVFLYTLRPTDVNLKRTNSLLFLGSMTAIIGAILGVLFKD